MGKSKIKKVKKNLLENIKNGLVKELKESTARIAKSSKKLDKLIDKSSLKLVKKLGRKLKLNKAAVTKPNEKALESSEASNVSTTSGKATSKPAKSTLSVNVPASVIPVPAEETKTVSPVKKISISRKTKVTE